MMTKRVREILSYYDSENPGVRTNLAFSITGASAAPGGS
jgi:hypothetical protein